MILCILVLLSLNGLAQGAESSPPERQDTVVVYNQRTPESEAVARHYVFRRNIPEKLVLGLTLPETETITRKDYAEQLENPILEFLLKSGGLEFDARFKAPSTANLTNTGPAGSFVKSASIRHVVLCYGVPSRILESSEIREIGSEKLPSDFRRNEAAVDTELAALPDKPLRLALSGPQRNPAFGATHAANIGPRHGVFIVARLDGPTPSVVTNMIDGALKAEEFGLWGRAYFDSRGLTNGDYKIGDDWIRLAAKTTKALGWETSLDEAPETLPPGFIMSHIALYAGWYSGGLCGPFLLKQMEFVPGSIAYHLHSFSASTIRSDAQGWVGPLLARGATATMGYVNEPYLGTTSEISVLFSRMLLAGFSFGEASYASLPALSWQTTVIGDPLYHPLPRPYQTLHSEMERAGRLELEWSYLRLINVNLHTGMPVASLIDYLEKVDLLRSSSVLQEKLGELYLRHGKVFEMIAAQERALSLPTSPQQRARLILSLAPRLALYERETDACKLYESFLKELPNYPDRALIQEKLLALERKRPKPTEATPQPSPPPMKENDR